MAGLAAGAVCCGMAVTVTACSDVSCAGTIGVVWTGWVITGTFM